MRKFPKKAKWLVLMVATLLVVGAATSPFDIRSFAEETIGVEEGGEILSGSADEGVLEAGGSDSESENELLDGDGVDEDTGLLEDVGEDGNTDSDAEQPEETPSQEEDGGEEEQPEEPVVTSFQPAAMRNFGIQSLTMPVAPTLRSVTPQDFSYTGSGTLYIETTDTQVRWGLISGTGTWRPLSSTVLQIKTPGYTSNLHAREGNIIITHTGSARPSLQIILDSANLTFPYTPVMQIEGGVSVELFLKGYNSLLGKGGIALSGNADLSIVDNDGGSGELACSNSPYVASAHPGIGAAPGEKANSINIFSGIVKAQGAMGAPSGTTGGAGIGAAADAASRVETINILDSAHINAEAGLGGAGIGGGYQGTVGTINIYGTGVGSRVLSGASHDGGAGIGAGIKGPVDEINIFGAQVTGAGNSFVSGGKLVSGAGIGSGSSAQGTVGSIVIGSNGTIVGNITGFSNAGNGAGIGSGSGGRVDSILITGGFVIGKGYSAASELIGGAGIGSGENGSVGSLTITGGNVNANGALNAAGIGTGYHGDFEKVEITGGMINATGGYGGAGIGATMSTTLDEINISGATVTATGGQGGAGIGGGMSMVDASLVEQLSAVGKIHIHSGASITATGKDGGAGIGGGTGYASDYGGRDYYAPSNVGEIVITDSTIISAKNEKDLKMNMPDYIVALSSAGGAGIGSGINGVTGFITIRNSRVLEAVGGTNSAGIGGDLPGDESDPAKGVIWIENSQVTATGEREGAGIGSTRMDTFKYGTKAPVNGRTKKILITGANTKIKATGGGMNSAGIGASSSQLVGEIEIDGATVEATGGDYGAGIGGGYIDKGDPIAKILIKNAKILLAQGGLGAAGIGGGGKGELTELTISNTAVTSAKGGYGGAGIGAGIISAVDTVTISGGTIRAEGGAGYDAANQTDGGAGIGGGGKKAGQVQRIVLQKYMNVAPVITAVGAGGGAGIGAGGFGSVLQGITIDAGSIDATGGGGGAGIGGGAGLSVFNGAYVIGDGTVGNILINDSASLKAKGSDYTNPGDYAGSSGAGIGAGACGSVLGDMQITKANIVSATGGTGGGAGIGAGSHGSVNGKFIIGVENGAKDYASGGVTIQSAVGGKDASGIGAGQAAVKGSIDIFACTITSATALPGGASTGIGGGGAATGSVDGGIQIKGAVITSAVSPSGGAGIGAAKGNVAGILISDNTSLGTITGGKSGAGIGAGQSGGNITGDIKILNSTVTTKVEGGYDKDTGKYEKGAGIGAADGGKVQGDIILQGTNNIASVRGGSGAAGIGSGSGAGADVTGKIEITGGTIVGIYAGDNGAAIGTGNGSAVTGGIFVDSLTHGLLQGGAGGAGIGTGQAGTTLLVSLKDTGCDTIKGGYNAASGGGADIGTGAQGAISGAVTIDGGSGTLAAKTTAAAIGTGKQGTLGKVEIIRSTLTTTGGTGAAAIGGGEGGSLSEIVFQGSSDITATGGQGAAGIGSGQTSGTFDIRTANETDIVLTATGGDKSGGAAGPGIGSFAGTGSAVARISIGNNTEVTATGGQGAFGGAGIGGGRVSGSQVSIGAGAKVYAIGGKGTTVARYAGGSGIGVNGGSGPIYISVSITDGAEVEAYGANAYAIGASNATSGAKVVNQFFSEDYYTSSTEAFHDYGEASALNVREGGTSKTFTIPAGYTSYAYTYTKDTTVHEIERGASWKKLYRTENGGNPTISSIPQNGLKPVPVRILYTVTITYNSGVVGSRFTPNPATEEADMHSTYTIAANASLPDVNFVGWRSSHDNKLYMLGDSKLPDTLNTEMDDITLTAEWQVSVTLHYNKGQGQADLTTNHSYNDTFPEPTEPTWTGHLFGGWFQAADLSGTAVTFPQTLTANLDLYAKWTGAVNLLSVPDLNFGSHEISARTKYYSLHENAQLKVVDTRLPRDETHNWYVTAQMTKPFRGSNGLDESDVLDTATIGFFVENGALKQWQSIENAVRVATHESAARSTTESDNDKVVYLETWNQGPGATDKAEDQFANGGFAVRADGLSWVGNYKAEVTWTITEAP